MQEYLAGFDKILFRFLRELSGCYRLADLEEIQSILPDIGDFFSL